MQHHRWRALTALACTGALAATVATGTASAQAPGGLPGFTPGHAARQLAAEGRLQQAIDPVSLGRTNRALSARNHLVGSRGEQRVWQQSLARLRSYGLDTRSASYSIYISKLRKVSLTMTAPTVRTLATRERNGYPWQQDVQNIVDGYNAYSPSGDVTRRSSTPTTAAPRTSRRSTRSG